MTILAVFVFRLFAARKFVSGLVRGCARVARYALLFCPRRGLIIIFILILIFILIITPVLLAFACFCFVC